MPDPRRFDIWFHPSEKQQQEIAKLYPDSDMKYPYRSVINVTETEVFEFLYNHDENVNDYSITVTNRPFEEAMLAQEWLRVTNMLNAPVEEPKLYDIWFNPDDEWFSLSFGIIDPEKKKRMYPTKNRDRIPAYRVIAFLDKNAYEARKGYFNVGNAGQPFNETISSTEWWKKNVES